MGADGGIDGRITVYVKRDFTNLVFLQIGKHSIFIIKIPKLVDDLPINGIYKMFSGNIICVIIIILIGIYSKIGNFNC